MGVEADVVCGHSVGEYAAACMAGVFSLEDAVKLISTRGKLMAERAQFGSMVSVFADREKIETILKDFSEWVSIAAINSKQHIVLSGETMAIQDIVEQLAQDAIYTKIFDVSHAFH